MRAAALLLIGACATSGGADPTSSGGGKADGAGDAQCSQQYIEWLLSTYKPAVVAQAADLATLAQQAPCRGELLEPTAWTTWMDATFELSFAPYMKRHFAALAPLVGPGDLHGNYDAYVAASMPTSDEVAAEHAMKAVQPAAALEGVDVMAWLGQVHSLAEEVLTPLLFPDTNQLEYEGPWTLNAGEAAALDLIADTMPHTVRDGAFAAWVDEYGSILRDGINVDTSDDYNAADPALGCFQGETAPCGRDQFLDRFVKLAPAAKGDQDSATWMSQLDLWASIAATSMAPYATNDDAQLARVDSVRPAKLSGTAAYKTWLDALASAASNPDVTANSVMPAKPCVGSDGAQLYSDFSAANPGLADAASPVTCQ